MELKCPQCAKVLTVSQEELVIHDSQVVCPQCLAVCRYENGALVVRDDSDAPYRHTAAVDTSKKDNSRFCHNCGKQIPAGISFCPYCGADLNAPFESREASPAPVQAPAAPVQQEKKPEPKKEQPAQPTTASRSQYPSHVEDKLRTMSHRYSSEHPHLHQNGSMPSRTFKIIAYAIIAALVALLVCIIIAGTSIETTI